MHSREVKGLRSEDLSYIKNDGRSRSLPAGGQASGLSAECADFGMTA